MQKPAHGHAPARARGPGRRLGFCLAISKTKPHAAGGGAPWDRLEKEERLLELPKSPQQGSGGQRTVERSVSITLRARLCTSMTSQGVKLTSLFFSFRPLPSTSAPPEADAAADENENNMKPKQQPTKTAVGDLRQSAIARSREKEDRGGAAERRLIS